MKVIRFKIFAIFHLKGRRAMILINKYRSVINELKKSLFKKQVIIILACLLMFILYLLHSRLYNDYDVFTNKFQTVLDCRDKDFESRNEIRGPFWVLKNFVRAEHGHIRCHETVTLATHATVEYFYHLQTLVDRWRAPISITVHAPGKDLQLAIDSIRFLRNCMHNDLIRKLVSFHIFFSYHHMSENFQAIKELMINETYDDCSKPPPYLINPFMTYMSRNKLMYPINVARNIAREAVLTHYLLSLDIDVYPSPDLGYKFLKMIAGYTRSQMNKLANTPNAFTIPIFQLQGDVVLPNTKADLEILLSKKSAIFLPNTPDCSTCSLMSHTTESLRKKNFSGMGNIENYFRKMRHKQFWDPIFIGTQEDPKFDERLAWEGMNDKFTLSYIMCVERYRISELKDEFLIQRKDLRPFPRHWDREVFVSKQTDLINSYILPDMKLFYGSITGCKL